MSKILTPDQSALLDAVAAALNGAPADDARAVAVFSRESVSRFALNNLHQGVERETATLFLQVAVGKRLGLVTASAPSAADLPRLIAQAADVARTMPETAEFDGFFRPPATPEFDDTRAATSALDAPARAALLRPAFEAAGRAKFGFAGTVGTRGATAAVLGRDGARRLGRRSHAEARLFAVDGTHSGFAGRTKGDAGGLELPALAELALARAARGRKTVALPPGKYPVILMPAAVAELVEWFGFIACTAHSVEDGMSVIAARAGQPIAGPNVTLRDDCRDPAGLPFPFDFEGRDRAPVDFIRGGTAAATVNDTLSARRLKQAPTGHAGLPGGEGAQPLHFYLDAGTAEESEMIAAIERGIYVTKFHYVNGYLDPHRAVMTGLTRDGAFLIENGRLAQGIENLRFTESLLGALSRVRMISRARDTLSAWWSPLGAYTMPALLIDDFTFTGAASDTAI